MTAFTPEYRLTVFAPPTTDATETTVLTPAVNAYHTDPFQVTTMQGLSGYKPYLGFPQGRKGTYDPLTAKSTIGQLVFKIQDQRETTASNLRRWVTAFVGDVTGKIQLSGLKAAVEESLDGGSTWSPFYVGRISDVSLDDVLSYGLTIREPTDDLMWNAFITRPVLNTSGAVMQSLLPLGTTSTYGPFPPASPLSGSWKVTGSGSVITITKKDQSNPANLFSNTLKNMAGTFVQQASGITWWGTESQFVTGSNTPTRLFLNSGSLAGQFAIAQLNVYQKQNVNCVTQIVVVELPTADPNYTPLSSISNNANVMVTIQPMYAPIDETNPVFISGVHPVQIFKDLCLGKYGRINVSTGQPINNVPIDNSAFNSLLADPSFGTPRFKVTKQMPIVDFFEKYLAPFGIGYRIEPQLQSGSIVGAIVPFDTRLPKSLAGLPTLTDTDLADFKGTWQMGKPLSQIQIKYYNEEYIPTVTNFSITPWRLTETTSTDIVLLPENLKSNGGTTQIDALGIRTDISNSLAPSSMYKTMESFYISRFGNGAATARLACRRTSTTNALKVGNWCLVQITHLPDALSHLRGGTRLMQVTERSENGVNVSFQLTDGGISAATAPPIVGNIASSSLYPTTALVLPAGAVTSSQRLEIDIAATDIGAARPVDSSSLWTKYTIVTPATTGSLNYTVGNLRANTRYYPRVRALATTGEQPSAWAFPGNSFKDTAPVTAPISASFTNLSTTGVDISWNNNGDISSSIAISVASPTGSVSSSVALLMPGSTTYRLTGLSTASAANPYQVYVTHRDINGVNSNAVSVIFRVSGSVAAPNAGRLTVESLAQVSFVSPQIHIPTGVVLGIYPDNPNFDLELQRTVTSASVADPTQWATIQTFPANTISPIGFLYWDQLPNDGALYWYQMRCIKTGYQDGAFTAAVSASTRQIDVNPGETADSLLSNGAYTTATNASSSAASAQVSASVGILSSSIAITTANSTSASLALVSSSYVITQATASAAYTSASLAALNIFTDSTGKIVKTPSTSSAGLYLGNTNLGFFSGSGWKTYMSNTGQFFLTGSSNSFLAWDGTNLNIAGAISLIDVTVPFGTSVTPGQNLLTSAQDWVIHSQPITASLVANFNPIYTTSNSIAITTGPYGFDVKAWKVISDGATVNGGWTTDLMTIDPTKTYRYTCWILRSGSGGSYHGVGGNTVADVATGTPQPSPYFASNFSPSDITGTQWYLEVGFVYPYNYGTTQGNDSGLYSKSTGQKVADWTDFKWASAAVTASVWEQYFEHAATGSTSYWYNPSVYVVDGSEPSIDSILGVGALAFASQSAASASLAGAVTTTNTTVTNNSSSIASRVTTVSSSLSSSIGSTSSSFAGVMFTDSTGKIIKTPNPSGQGLWLGSDHLGFYSGSGWETYMDNAGNFYLTGSNSGYLKWDGTNLNIAGNINILSATASFGVAFGTGQNLINTANQWVLTYPNPITSFTQVINFDVLGILSSQSIATGSTPYGTDDKIWHVQSSTNGAYQGGWRTDQPNIPINPNWTYRYSVWVRSSGSTGEILFGADQTCIADIPTGLYDNNPYFVVPQCNTMSDQVWYLLVGYIYPYNYGTLQHNNGGWYRSTDGAKVGNATDYKWLNVTGSSAYWRTALYGTTVTGETADFYSPQLYVCDGSEPTIDSILAMGVDAYALGVTNQTNITNNSSSFAGVSFTDSTGKVIKTPNPSGQGLWLGSTNLGYYSGSNWLTYMSNTGNFFLTGSATNYLAWNGTTLTVAGTINIVGGNAATTSSVNSASSSLAASLTTTNTTVTNNSSSLASSLTTTNTTVTNNSASLAATIFTNTTGLVTKTPSPSGKGLFLGSTNLGYYSGSAWYTYMDNTGKFYLNGTGANSLFWDGVGTLSITGSISATSGTIDGDLTIRDPGQLLVNTATTTGSIAIGQYDTQNSGFFSTFTNPATPVGTAKILFGKTAVDGNELNILAPQTLFIGAGCSNDFSSKGGSDTTPISFIRFDANSTSSYRIRYISSNNDTPYTLQRFSGAPYTPSSSYAHAFDGDVVMYRTNQGTHTGPVLTVYGDMVVSGTIRANSTTITATTFSDSRMKSNILTLTSSLDNLDKISGVEFTWNEKSSNSGSHDVGVIAQDVMTVLPDAVKEVDGYYSVEYFKLVPMLIQAMKEMKSEMKGLRDELAALKKS